MLSVYCSKNVIPMKSCAGAGAVSHLKCAMNAFQKLCNCSLHPDANMSSTYVSMTNVPLKKIALSFLNGVNPCSLSHLCNALTNICPDAGCPCRHLFSLNKGRFNCLANFFNLSHSASMHF